MEALHRQGQDRGDHDDADPRQEGVGMGASGLVAVAVHAAGYLGLNQDQTPTAQETRASGDSDA